MVWSTGRGGIDFNSLSSREQMDQLETLVKPEEVLLLGHLEHNNAMLIRQGLAHKVQQYGVSIDPRERVNERTQFQVSQTGAHIPLHFNGNILVPGSVCVNIAQRVSAESRSGWSTIYQIGKRIVEDGEVLDAEPTLPGITKEDVLFAGSLLDRILTDVRLGRLPHLQPDLMHALSVSPKDLIQV